MRNLKINDVEVQGVDETLTKHFDELINKVRDIIAQQGTVHSADDSFSH